MSIATPNYSVEQSICAYLASQNTVSGSLLSGSNITYYTGIGNVDVIDAPAVIVDASDSREVVTFSRCYEFNTKITVKEMAADVSSLGVTAESVFNEFVNTNSASVNFTNPAYNISVWQVQTMGMTPSFNGDALMNTIDVKIIGALVPK